MNRLTAFLSLALVIGSMPERPAHAAAANGLGLPPEQAITGSGVIDLQPTPEDLAAGRSTPGDLKRHLRDLCSNKETVKRVGAYINRRRYFERGTLLNPWTAYRPGGSPAIPPDKAFFGQSLAAEALAGDQKKGYLASLGIEELAEGYKKGGVTFRFMDVKLTYALQRVPNCRTRPGERSHRADFDLAGADFKEKYYLLTEGTDHSGREFRFGDRISANPSRKSFHPAEVCFDPGVPDGATAPVAAGKGDPSKPETNVLMQSYVKLDGRVDSYDGSQWTTAMNFTELNLIASRDLYMEDVVPPLPSTADINESPTEIEPSPASSALKVAPKHDFVVMARAGSPDPAGDVAGAVAWPSGAINEDANGDGKNDHAFEPVHVLDRNSNSNASDIKVSFNYETGLSLANRVKVKDGDGYRYMYLVLPENTEAGVVGPYGGRVGQAPAPSEVAEADPYEPTDDPIAVEGEAQPVTMRQLLEPFYREVSFESDPDLKAAVEYLGTHTPVEVQTAQRPKPDGKKDYENATYKRVAGISMNEEREVVQGLDCDVFDNKSSCDGHMNCTVDFKFKVKGASLLPPSGFASFEGGNFRPSLDAKTYNVTGPASLSGGPLNALDAGDNFYQINAGDGCGNTTIFRTGTFAVKDNLRPNPKVVIEEMYTRPGRDQRLIDVVTVPNDAGGSGDPIGSYDLARPHSRLPTLAQAPAAARKFGNFRNNAEVWDGSAQKGSLSNPVDGKGTSFLSIRSAPDAPPISEDARLKITIVADDNVAPKLDRSSATPRFLYPISQLSARIYRKDDPQNAPHAVDVIQIPQAQLSDASQFTRPPVTTFEHIFRAAGAYEMEVTAVDRSLNKRVLRFPITVGKVDMQFRQMEGEQQRGGGD